MSAISEMNPEIRTQWLADLRDGTRSQGTGRMRGFEGEQCCLDVLAEQAVNAGVIPEPVLSEGTTGYAYHWFDEDSTERWEDSVLPKPVAEWAGLGRETNPAVHYGDREGHEDCDDTCNDTCNDTELSELNDSAGLSFTDIADLIEAEARMYTPDNITHLGEHEIFVFGSNTAGLHGAGAAKYALDHFGANWGNGEGWCGRSYAYPTLDANFNQRSREDLEVSRDKLYSQARNASNFTFYLTKMGCGLGGYEEDYMKTLFTDSPENIVKPLGW